MSTQPGAARPCSVRQGGRVSILIVYLRVVWLAA